MRILEENNYILECWKCDTKIIYTYKDCSFDSRYSSYELCCPNCHNRYSSTRNELFGKKYKENEYNSDEKEIKSLNHKLEIANNKLKMIKKVREYIMSNLITEWDIKNGGYVSGSDLPVDAITPILEILDKVEEV